MAILLNIQGKLYQGKLRLKTLALALKENMIENVLGIEHFLNCFFF